MKICTKCKIEKDDSEFGKRYDKLQPYCKECNNKNHKHHYQENKAHYVAYSLATKWKLRAKALQFVMEYAKGGCEHCNEKDFVVLEFDHKNPSKKEFSISKMVSGGYGIPRIKKELKKCRILCSNCHKRHTAKQSNWYTNVLKHAPVV